MKAIMLSILMFGGVLTSCSQEDDVSPKDVPSVVLNTFNAQFAKAVDIEWEKHGENYEAEFDIDRTDHKALIEGSGSMLMFKHDIPASELPAEVQSTLDQDFADYKIEDPERLEKEGIVYYQIEMEKGEMEEYKVFSADGTIDESLTYWD